MRLQITPSILVISLACAYILCIFSLHSIHCYFHFTFFFLPFFPHAHISLLTRIPVHLFRPCTFTRVEDAYFVSCYTLALLQCATSFFLSSNTCKSKTGTTSGPVVGPESFELWLNEKFFPHNLVSEVSQYICFLLCA